MAKKATRKSSGRRGKGGGNDSAEAVRDYRHEDKRKNNPEAGLVTPEAVREGAASEKPSCETHFDPQPVSVRKPLDARGNPVLATILVGDCARLLDEKRFREAGISEPVCLTFLDPPFNQGKEYAYFDDTMSEGEYWRWMGQICEKVNGLTADGGAIYFMQREKNTEQVLRCLREAGWTLQNVIIWMKRTSAVPNSRRFGKQYQIIAFATKGERARVFHRLRTDAPLRPDYKQPRKHGLFVTDCWEDIRELTSGYFAGEEALRRPGGERFHKQQSPVALLLRLVLSSSNPGDLVLDPFAGTGTTLVVAEQLARPSVGIEIDPKNGEAISRRLEAPREADSVLAWRHYYRFTPGLESIWPSLLPAWKERDKQMALIE
jgi:DNA modification methylase